MKIQRRLLMLLIVAALASGCAVTTDRLTSEELSTRVKEDRMNMYVKQEPLLTQLSLEEALARGLSYNLDHRVKLMEDALSLKQVELMTFDMLPRVVAAAGYTERDSYNASSSYNVEERRYNYGYSTSTDKGRYTGDLTMTWNILDFGVSYFQAKQQAERAHIMHERRRKVVHTIFQQIRQTYWQALGAQQLEGQFQPLLKEVNAALRDVERIEAEKLRPALETLNYKKTLLEIIKQLEAFRDELSQAKSRLASLINLPVGQDFTLVVPDSLTVPELAEGVEAMEIRALAMRPELREVDYNKRVSAHEVKKTILRMLPGVEMTVGGHFDGNTFLMHQKWIEGSARLTWNLLNLISGPSQYKLAKGQEDLVQTQRMALSMAVLTQVHVAYQDYQSRKRQYELADSLMAIDAKIHEQTSHQAGSGAESRLNAIKSATGSLMADYRRYQNYAALQNAYGQMISTLGYDPLPETVPSHDLNTLTKEIRKRLNALPVGAKKATLSQTVAPIPIVAAVAAAPLQKPEAAPAQAAPALEPVAAVAAPEPVVAASEAMPEQKQEQEATAPVPEQQVAAEQAPKAAPVALAVAQAAGTDSAGLARLKRLAMAGDAAAQRRLGWLYAKGSMGLPLDKSEAVAWYEKAANNGDAEAQVALGWLYYSGDGVTADRTKSVGWYKKAAGQGNSRAVSMLRKMEKNGI